ncbi:hypothetical protein TSOC_002897 [Tetrabaena socialis]|uniref:Uncharacterized protein n=1 Tax=Tetrabaena socialis TaxID=47790 RepID=A0A2J8ACY2_9CHLO|nr:hypothetical protein TSOC_002897 [Tetrabaena socialis]|eukprot:PNH10371.1 hypothetical protein TSOC_002897 [Tetrabaena socialis]
MAHVVAAQRCIALLDETLPALVSRACAFEEELRGAYMTLLEARPLLSDMAQSKHADAFAEVIEGLERALRTFLDAAERCCVQGPMETLLTAPQLMYSITNSCVSARLALAPLQPGGQLTMVVVAQAKLLAAALFRVTVNFSTLARLHAACLELQTEAERVRVGLTDEHAFASLVSRLMVNCSPGQLAADAAFLSQQASEARARDHVHAYFVELAAGIIQELLPGPEPAAASAKPGGQGQAASGCEPASPQQQPRGAAGVLSSMGKHSVPQEERAAELGMLHTALRGEGRAAAAQTVLEDGLGVQHLLRQMSGTQGPLRTAALKALVALLEAEPGCSGQLVEARGVQLLVHLLGGVAWAAEGRSYVLDGGGIEAAPATAFVTLVPRQRGATQGRSGGQGAAVSSPKGKQVLVDAREETQLFVDAVNLVRLMVPSHTADLVAAGAIKVLCRVVLIKQNGGQLASAAVAALADAAAEGPAAVQVLQERSMAAALVKMAQSQRPSEAGPAIACLTALLQHAIQPPGQRSAQNDELRAELGRACDAATVSVLLDIVGVASADGTDGWQAAAAPGALELLPYCAHSPETRASMLRHSSGMRCLMQCAAGGDAAASAVFRRLGADDQCKTAVARQLSQVR